MPIRIASMKNRISANGLALHRAKEGGAAEAEAGLAEERKKLKEERDQRKAKALLPGPSALDRLVRTHHPEARSKPAKKEAHSGDDTTKPKARRSRAEKQAEKAAAVEASRRSPKKPVK